MILSPRHVYAWLFSRLKILWRKTKQIFLTTPIFQNLPTALSMFVFLQVGGDFL